MSRTKKYAIRSALYAIEGAIPRQKSQINEWERDLIATASCAIWDENTPKLEKCLRRLKGSPERSQAYEAVYDMLQM